MLPNRCSGINEAKKKRICSYSHFWLLLLPTDHSSPLVPWFRGWLQQSLGRASDGTFPAPHISPQFVNKHGLTGSPSCCQSQHLSPASHCSATGGSQVAVRIRGAASRDSGRGCQSELRRSSGPRMFFSNRFRGRRGSEGEKCSRCHHNHNEFELSFRFDTFLPSPEGSVPHWEHGSRKRGGGRGTRPPQSRNQRGI